MQTYQTYLLFDKTLAVLSESRWLSKHIHCFLRPLAVKPNGPPDYRLGIFKGRTPDLATAHLCCPDLDVICRAREGTPAWVVFRQCFMRMALSQNHPQYVMHGAVVAGHDGRCALVIGDTGAGKTTTMLGLLQRGWEYVSDDYACVPLATGRLRPLTTGCTVTQCTFEAYPQLESLRSDAYKCFHRSRWEWTIQPADMFPAVPADASFKPSHLFFLYRDNAVQSAIEPIPDEDALWWVRLARFGSWVATPFEVNSSLAYHRQTCEYAKAFARDVRMYRVMNGAIHDTVRLIHECLTA